MGTSIAWNEIHKRYRMSDESFGTTDNRETVFDKLQTASKVFEKSLRETYQRHETIASKLEELDEVGIQFNTKNGYSFTESLSSMHAFVCFEVVG